MNNSSFSFITFNGKTCFIYVNFHKSDIFATCRKHIIKTKKDFKVVFNAKSAYAYHLIKNFQVSEKINLHLDL